MLIKKENSDCVLGLGKKSNTFYLGFRQWVPRYSATSRIIAGKEINWVRTLAKHYIQQFQNTGYL